MAGAFAQQNTLLVYGTLGLESQKLSGSNVKEHTFNFSPAVGYQWDDHWTGGLVLGTSSTKSTTASGADLKTSQFTVGPFVRYAWALSDIFAVYGQFNATYLSSKQDADTRYNGFQGVFFPAIGVNMKNGFALNFGFGNLSYSTAKVKNSSSNLNDFKLTFGDGVNFGISKNFGLKK